MWRMKRKVNATLKADKTGLTTEVGEQILTELAKGDVQEAFRNLKGWYQKVMETQTRRCHLTMECQTNKPVPLYTERAAYS
jgi:hypothetical protein